MNKEANHIYFSVVIPLYNKERYIVRTVNSVLNQSYQNFEIVIVDDGSSDKSLQKVKSLNSNKIRIISQNNMGVSVARNKGVLHAKYDWITFLDADDEYESEFLEVISSSIINNTEIKVFATNRFELYKNNQINNTNCRFVPKNKGVIKNFYKSFLFGPCPVHSSSICINRSILSSQELKELFPVGIKRGEDLDTWVRIALNHEIFFINQRLSKYNIIPDSVSNSFFNYKDAFDYSNWINYQTNDFAKSFFLRALVLQRKLLILKKTIITGRVDLVIKYIFGL